VIIRAVLILLTVSLLASCSTLQNTSNTLYRQSLNGDWRLTLIKPRPGTEATSLVSVPSNWTSSGIEHAGEAIYSRQFTIDNHPSPKIDSEHRYWLDFSAVDYAAKISVNNQDVGRHTGYFSPFSLDISNAITAGDNQLTVVVSSPNEELTADWSLNKTLIKGVLSHHDTRPGGAWSDRGQDRNSGGIWGDVTLRKTGLVAIENVKVNATVINVTQQQTQGNVAISLDSDYQGLITLVFSLQNDVKDEKYQITVPVIEGKQTINWQLPAAQRSLWWPWDWGTPDLHKLTVSALINDNESDFSQQNIGFRTFRFDDDSGVFYVNNQAYFIRGTNYIASQWLGSVSAQNYFDDIQLMRHANINSIRVHGHVAGLALYQQADKLGMIIWQDFPLQWGYSDEPDFIRDAVSQVRDMTDMLYNHASIAFWCGQNEPPWDATWMKYKYPSYQSDKNIDLTEAVYQQLLTTGDTRIVRKASYTAEHPWLGWYSGSYKDYSNKPKTAIISEFGAQAMPDYHAVIDMLGEKPAWPLSAEAIEQLNYHNYQPRETLQIAKINEGESLSQFVINSQEYQRLVTKYAVEQLRLNKGLGLAAIYQFMFNDSWNSITWSVLDVERKAKPGYFALQQAYQPLLAIFRRVGEGEDGLISVAIINDSLTDHHNVKMQIKDNNSLVIWEIKNLNIKANSQFTVLKNQLVAGLSTAITLTLFDQQDNVISKNEYLPQDL